MMFPKPKTVKLTPYEKLKAKLLKDKEIRAKYPRVAAWVKRKAIRKVGKRGKINLEANKELKKLFQQKGINRCELHFLGCWGTNALSYVHRHKRRDYYGKEKLLTDFLQVLLGCVPCHQILEQDAKLTEEVFLKLRGPEL